MSGRRAVNIVVVGDPGVGKTSLILAVATQEFPEHPVPTLPPTRLPAELSPEGVSSIVVDSSSRPEDRPMLEAQCLKADVILLLWSKDSADSLHRLSSHWLPELRRVGVTVPIILVAARQDRGPDPKRLDLRQEINPLMTQFREIEACLECSAKKLNFVEDVFYYALKAVIHPTAPLFDTHTCTLKPDCIKALRRIFMLCDADRDNALNDQELNRFQVHCWNTPLKQAELDGIKKVVAEKMPGGVNENGLTIRGFVYLQSLFIERGKLETTWAVLRSYGYADDLSLRDDLLDGASFAVAPDQIVELNDHGREFLRSIFKTFDRDKDLALCQQEQNEMFSTAPAGPWEGSEWDGVLVETARSGALTQSGFLCKWAYLAMKDPRAAYAYGLYLGYKGDASQILSVSKRRKQERKQGYAARSILNCYVFGASGSGKSSILQGLVGLPHMDGDGTRGSMVAVGMVETAECGKTLVMSEISPEQAKKVLASSDYEERSRFIGACDIAVFVFDSSSLGSFREAHDLLLQMTSLAGDTMPCLLVAAKDDLGMSQELVQECQDACTVLQMEAPIQVSMRIGETSSIYSQVVHAACHPQLYIPETPALKALRQYQRSLRKCLVYTGAGLAGWATIYILYHKLFKKQGS